MGINENDGLQKNELITKLEAISVLYKKALSIKSKMNNYTPEDNYERKVIVPVFPGEYDDEEDRESWMVAIDHKNDNAVEQMSDFYDEYYQPKKPAEPRISEFKKPKNRKNEEKQRKLKNWSLGLAAAGIFFAVGGLLNLGESNVLTIFIIAAAFAIGSAFFKMLLLSEKEKESKYEAAALSQYNSEVNSIKAQYNDDLKAYEVELNAYKLRRQAFLDEYSKWRSIYLESVKEEQKISQKLEADRQAAVKKINDDEFMPAANELGRVNNDLLTMEYIAVVDVLINLLKSGRADNLKEAINRYEEMVYRERQLQLQKQQEEQRRYEEELRRQDEERRYQEQMEFKQKQERQRQYEANQQLKMQEQQHREEIEFQKKQEEARKREAQASRQKRCVWCAHNSTCRQQYYDGAYNCTGFTPR